LVFQWTLGHDVQHPPSCVACHFIAVAGGRMGRSQHEGDVDGEGSTGHLLEWFSFWFFFRPSQGRARAWRGDFNLQEFVEQISRDQALPDRNRGASANKWNDERIRV
jgi:hypothetical protein